MKEVPQDVMVFTQPDKFVRAVIKSGVQCDNGSFQYNMNITEGVARTDLNGTFRVLDILRHFDIQTDAIGGCKN